MKYWRITRAWNDSEPDYVFYPYRQTSFYSHANGLTICGPGGNSFFIDLTASNVKLDIVNEAEMLAELVK